MYKLLFVFLLYLPKQFLLGDTISLSDFKQALARNITKEFKCPPESRKPHSFSMITLVASFDANGSVSFFDSNAPTSLSNELRRVLGLSYEKKFKRYVNRLFLVTLLVSVDEPESVPYLDVRSFVSNTTKVLSEQDVIVLPTIEVYLRSGEIK